jgi:hypothetical protein
VVIAANEIPIINLSAIQTGSEVHRARAIINIPAPNIPARRVRFTPYSSIVLPTRGAPSAIPINIAAAVIPIRGVGISFPSRITDVTGIMIPQENPTVNTAIITVNNGVVRKFMPEVILGVYGNVIFIFYGRIVNGYSCVNQNISTKGVTPSLLFD